MGEIVVGNIGDIGQPQCYKCTKKTKRTFKKSKKKTACDNVVNQYHQPQSHPSVIQCYLHGENEAKIAILPFKITYSLNSMEVNSRSTFFGVS